MNFVKQRIEGVYIVELKLLEDERGGFARTFCKNEFEKIGHTKEFVQMNQSWNLQKGTVRGMHYQVPPYREVKVVRCVRGKVLDVVVDIRKGSPTFLQHLAVELSEENKFALYIPEGFAHGFQTLEDNTELIYMHTEYFTPNADRGLNYADPQLAIRWPLPVSKISEKDKNHSYMDSQFEGI